MKNHNKRIYLATPTMHGEELKYMQEAYETNWMSTVGENINAIERDIASYVEETKAVALSSGTAALHLAIKLAGVKPGDRVFCSDLTFSATVNPVVYEGGIPIFIDSEYETWNMDPKALEKAFKLYDDVKVVVLVNLYGVPAKLDEIRAVCKKHGALLIEDAAESLGATYMGKQTGAFGDIGITSFNGNKIITGSSGGMLFSSKEEDIAKAKKWSTQSRENASWYQHEDLGYNYRMSNVIAGVVRGQFIHLNEHVKAKKVIYDRYKEGFKNLPIKMNPFDENKSEPNFWLSSMIIDKDAMCEQKRGSLESEYISQKGKTCPEEILKKLAEINIEGRPIWKPMHMQPIFKDSIIVSLDEERNVDKDIFHRGLCLPSDNKMTEEEQNRIIEVIVDCFS